MDATTQQESAVKGDTIKVNCVVNKRNNAAISLQSIAIKGIDTITNVALQNNQNYTYDLNVLIQDKVKDVTQPYWLQEPQEPGSFNVYNQNDIGKAWNDPVYIAEFSVIINGTHFSYKKPVQYKYTHPSRGELYEPFVVKPYLSMYLSPQVALTDVKFIGNNKLQIDSNIHVIYKPSFTMKNVPVTLYILQDTIKTVFENELKDFEKVKKYTIDVPISKFFNPSKGNTVEAAIKIKLEGKEYMNTDFFKTISYDHIPDIHYLFKSRVKFVNEEVKIVGKKVGYIPGAGDFVPDALQQMGYDLKILYDKDLTDDNLKQFDAVITGIRAYNIYDFISNKYDVLVRYMQNGGNLIVQYNKSNFINNERTKISPYPFTINSSSRVTEEDAKVNFLLPNHPVLNYPNKITDKDFEGWIQERSTYQAEQLDNHFEAILGMNDKGEKESNGSLIIAKYGKGNFVYTGLVLFRELPAGVSGAYRLMANLIALPKH
jgi:hypothetical protein